MGYYTIKKSVISQIKGGIRMDSSKWFKIAGVLMLGLFVAFLDRINLSIALLEMSHDVGFSGPQFGIMSGYVLTAFLWGYGIFNFLGGIFTRHINPRMLVIVTMFLWSVITALTGIVTSVILLIVFRFLLGMFEGIYYPQQSRFARAWFTDAELSRANSLIHFYGQSLGLGLGYLILTPIYHALGWRMLFYVTGAVGIIIIVPLFWKFLKWKPEFNESNETGKASLKFTFSDLGGVPSLLLYFVFFAQSALFWGTILWIPLVVKSLNFTGIMEAVMSAAPFFGCLILGWPMSVLSDRLNKRVLVTAIGLFASGIALVGMPYIDAPVWKMILITFAFAFCASTFLPNILSIIQSSVKPDFVGAQAGIASSAGSLGGVISGMVVGWLHNVTGTYFSGFFFLGAMVILAGIAVILHKQYKRPVY